MSCENCRSRKVKCIKPNLDSCQRCQRLGKQCVTTGERYARPYYYTSKEKYELIARVIQHFVPSATLDTEGLRQIIDTFDQHSRGPGPSSVGKTVEADAQNILPPPNTPSLPDGLDEDEGAMLDDAMNILRYESGSSAAVFHQKICSSMLTSHCPFSSVKTMRREGIQDGQIVESARASDLPKRTILEAAAGRFFAEVNSVIFVMNEDLFQYRLDDIYNTRQNCSNSFLAILYLVLALGEKSEIYFKAACSLFDKSVEEGGEESIQVVMLTSQVLYRQNRNQRNLAWILLGIGIRIAQSLGLHLTDGLQKEHSAYRAQCKRRLWSSLYELEQLLACALGKPSGIMEIDMLPGREMEVYTSAFTPLGYGAQTAAFGNIIRCICSHMYLGTQNRIPMETTASALINQVEVWWNALPDYLRHTHLSAPSHSRAIWCLGLRYNYALMLITRRYLLQSLLSGSDCTAEVVSRIEVCERANDRSTAILLDMAKKDMISDLIWFDTHFILCNNVVLYLRSLRHASSPTRWKQLRDFIPLLKLTRNSRLGEYTLRCTEALLAEVESNSASEYPLASFDCSPMAAFLESADDNLMTFFDQPDGLDYSDVLFTGP
ncbi:hypothetical protein BDZ45DRAFT_699513 [Acephala macrosclerotiorum]|nr:hypothetical protein BDZ45DRAFT_699513 [Acephala macrosclerotiorum]